MVCAAMRLLVLALVLMTVSSCLIAKASKFDHNKDKWLRRGLYADEENSIEFNDQYGSKARFERSKPHVNVGSIGHVDKGRPSGHVDNVENEKFHGPGSKRHGRGLVEDNEGNGKEGYPSSNVNNHHYIPRQDFPSGGGTGGGSG